MSIKMTTATYNRSYILWPILWIFTFVCWMCWAHFIEPFFSFSQFVYGSGFLFVYLFFIVAFFLTLWPFLQTKMYLRMPAMFAIFRVFLYHSIFVISFLKFAQNGNSLFKVSFRSLLPFSFSYSFLDLFFSSIEADGWHCKRWNAGKPNLKMLRIFFLKKTK